MVSVIIIFAKSIMHILAITMACILAPCESVMYCVLGLFPH